MASKMLDLRLYLVTDSTPAILKDKDIFHVVEEAIKGGVTIVQYRDKHADTGRMVTVAKGLLDITRKHGIPFLINDRVDVALAVGADGVHIGQDDMDISKARELLPKGSIIGVTASSIKEAQKAIADGADYLGIGTVFGTPTKQDTKSIIGTQGTQEILRACETGTKHRTPCVAIGGLNSSNVQRVLHQSTFGHSVSTNALNGVAVVSAIVAASDPQAAARELRTHVDQYRSTFYARSASEHAVPSDLKSMLGQIAEVVRSHGSSSVLCHNMTNTVVQNFAANVCLATGSSPIMSLNGEEASDLAQLGGALVINMGTVTPDILDAYKAGMKAYNKAGNPVVFDPVGGGATAVRKRAIKMLLTAGFFDVIKGNEGEISAVMGVSGVQQRGVDSGPSTSTPEQKAALVQMLAQRERCIVLMSGAVDYLSDGKQTIAISNGSHWLGKITGSGCALGSVIASYLAVWRKDKLVAVLAAILHYEIAAERVEKSPSCRGPGSFIPAFLDELYNVRNLVSQNGDISFPNMAKVEHVTPALS